MTPIIDAFARRIWYALLWFMRRPSIKRLRLTFPKYLPERKRAAAWESFRKQERWARRYGLQVMRWTVGFFLLIIAMQLIGAGVLELQMRGMLGLPGQNEAVPAE